MNHIVSRGHSRPVNEINFSNDNDRTLLVSSAHDKMPQIRNGETGDWIGSFHGHKGAVWSIKLDPISRTLAATASGDFSAKLWCASTGKELIEFKHKHVVKSIDFSHDARSIATGCQDGLIRIYDSCQPQLPPQEIKVATSFDDSISKLNWAASGSSTIIVGKRSGVIELWDPRSGAGAAVSKTSLNTGKVVMDMELHEDKDLLIAASDKNVFLISLSTLSIVKTFDTPSPMNFLEEGGVSLSPDGSKFLSGASDLWLREFDVNSGDLLRTLKGHHGPIRCVRYHPNGIVGASGSEDATIRLWDLTAADPPN